MSASAFHALARSLPLSAFYTRTLTHSHTLTHTHTHALHSAICITKKGRKGARLLSLQYMQCHWLVCPGHNSFIQLQFMSYSVVVVVTHYFVYLNQNLNTFDVLQHSLAISATTSRN